jgi:hypothetical protein
MVPSILSAFGDSNSDIRLVWFFSSAVMGGRPDLGTFGEPAKERNAHQKYGRNVRTLPLKLREPGSTLFSLAAAQSYKQTFVVS